MEPVKKKKLTAKEREAMAREIERPLLKIKPPGKAKGPMTPYEPPFMVGGRG